MASSYCIQEPLPGTRYNNDLVILNRVITSLAERGGYCPCSMYRDDEHICHCLDYRTTKLCRCGLYVKDE